MSIKTFSIAKDLIHEIESGHHFDLLFLDIQMPELNGWDAAKLIKSLDKSILIVFLTISSAYVYDGYEYAWRYIAKPISLEKMNTLLCAASELKIPRRISVQADGCITSIMIRDIIYVEVRRNNVTLHTKCDLFTFRSTLTEIEHQLSLSCFVRSHESYIVNLSYVDRAFKSDIHLNNGEVIPLSRKRSELFWNAFKIYIRS